jgi:glutathione S-transferase
LEGLSDSGARRQPLTPRHRLTTAGRLASQVPSETFARCVMEQWMDQAERVLTPLVMRALMGDAAALAALQHVLQHLDTALVKSPKLAGGSLSLADVRGPSRLRGASTLPAARCR